jgi:manganese/zinc/iron transport system permease protein
MIAPPAAAYLLTDRLGPMLALSAAIGAASAVAGYWVAVALDASIAGAIAAMTGAAFLAALLLAPERGVLAAARRRRDNRRRFAFAMLALHLAQHEELGEAADENRVATLHGHLGWDANRVTRVVAEAESDGLVVRRGGIVALTARGRTAAAAVVRQ